MGVVVDRDAAFYFMKDASSIVLSGSTINYPPGTHNCHHEIELVVAIGAPAYHISTEEASSVVLGYACGIDLTRRDLQFVARDKGRPWDLGKNFENSAVISAIVNVSVSGFIDSGAIRLSVNDEIRQEGDIRDLIWTIPEIIADLSQYYHLVPGDLIFTGTPAGVGPVLPGDRITGRIDNVGEIEVTIAP
jgi:fumarylpyruvate hydrolase